MFKVKVTEHERGWGTDTWINEYETKVEALKFIEGINSENNTLTVPDIYYTTEYLGEE